jgi:hypothetical protein
MQDFEAFEDLGNGRGAAAHNVGNFLLRERSSLGEFHYN